MIPAEPKEFDPRSHEGEVFRALEKLSNDYYVFHSVETVAIDPSNAMTVHETDFLVVNKSKGILSIEVKAGSGIDYEGGQWKYTSGLVMPHGGPYHQARVASSTLRTRIKNHEIPAVQKMSNHCKFSSAVWFPDMSSERMKKMHFPPDARKEITLGNEDLENPAAAISRIMDLDVYAGSMVIENRMTQDDLQLLIHEVLCPTFHLVKMPSIERYEQEAKFNMLLKEQVAILDFLDEQPSAVINGVAGTGKTMVAVEKARRHSIQGEKVLFLCFNRLLRDHLEKVYKTNASKEITKEFQNVDFMTISMLALHKTGDMTNFKGLEDWILESADDTFEYKHVIVDEGQDFAVLGAGQSDAPEQGYGNAIIDALEMAALESNGTFYLFCDQKQMVQGQNANAQIPECITHAECRLTLHRNCRNTKEIAKTSMKPLPDEERVRPIHVLENSGPEPHMIVVEDKEKQITCLNQAIDELRKASYDNIVILTMNSMDNSILSQEAEKLPGGDYYRYYRYNGKDYMFSTCSKFKGLEADAIIMVDVNASSFDEKAMYFYVGTSRARIRLEIIANMSMDDCMKVTKILSGKNAPPQKKKLEKVFGVVLGCRMELV